MTTPYKLVPIKSRPGAFFAIDDSDYERYVVNMPSWALTGSTGKYLQCDWNTQKGRFRPRLNRLLLLGIDDDQSKVVDHINGDTLDNRRCNLRILPKGANVAHRPNMNTNNTSGTRGVYWCKTSQRWIGCINHKDDVWWKKSFTDKDEAIRETTKQRNEYDVMHGIYVSDVPDRLPELQKSHEIIDKFNEEHPGKINHKPSSNARANYNEKRRQQTSEKRRQRLSELEKMERTDEVQKEIDRIHADETRSHSKLTGEKVSLEEQRARYSEKRRAVVAAANAEKPRQRHAMSAAMERDKKREELLKLEQTPEVIKQLKSLEKADAIAHSRIHGVDEERIKEKRKILDKENNERRRIKAQQDRDTKRIELMNMEQTPDVVEALKKLERADKIAKSKVAAAST